MSASGDCNITTAVYEEPSVPRTRQPTKYACIEMQRIDKHIIDSNKMSQGLDTKLQEVKK